MSFRRWLACALLPLVLVACTKEKINLQKESKALDLATDQAVDLDRTKPGRQRVVRTFDVPGEGTVTVNVEQVNQNAKLDIVLFPSGTDPLPMAQGQSPLEAPNTPKGTYYLLVRHLAGPPTRIKLNVGFDPKDPDAASGEDGKPEGAQRIEAAKTVRGHVDYVAMDRTDYLQLTTTDNGALTFRFKPTNVKGKVTAEVQPPKGDNLPIDLRNGLEIKEAQKGDYLVKIQADKASSADYTLDTTFDAGNVEANSGDDATAEGAIEMNFKPKPGAGQNQIATNKDEVCFDKRDRTDWFKFAMPDKGKASIVLKPVDRSSKIRAEFVRNDQDEDGERIRSGYTIDLDKGGPYFVKVFAPDKGDCSKYALEVEYIPNVYIDAKIVELDKKMGCAVMVDKGTQHGVRQGVQANIVGAGGAMLGTGVVENAFPALSRVKVFNSECRFSPDAKAQIQGGY